MIKFSIRQVSVAKKQYICIIIQNNPGFASILLNRYLDINEIIEDPDNNNIPEDDEFKLTDIPSLYDVNMPMKNFVAEAEK